MCRTIQGAVSRLLLFCNLPGSSSFLPMWRTILCWASSRRREVTTVLHTAGVKNYIVLGILLPFPSVRGGCALPSSPLCEHEKLVGWSLTWHTHMEWHIISLLDAHSHGAPTAFPSHRTLTAPSDIIAPLTPAVCTMSCHCNPHTHSRECGGWGGAPVRERALSFGHATVGRTGASRGDGEGPPLNPKP